MKPSQTFEMYVLPHAQHEGQVIGLHAVPGRLPVLHRFPGETTYQMTRRALLMATPGPSFSVAPILKGSTPC